MFVFEAFVGELILTAGNVASITNPASVLVEESATLSVALIVRSPLEVMFMSQTTMFGVTCVQLKPEAPAVVDGSTITLLTFIPPASLALTKVLVIVVLLLLVGALIKISGGVESIENELTASGELTLVAASVTVIV